MWIFFGGDQGVLGDLRSVKVGLEQSDGFGGGLKVWGVSEGLGGYLWGWSQVFLGALMRFVRLRVVVGGRRIWGGGLVEGQGSLGGVMGF